jgi:TonB-dependent receptor
VQHQKIVNVTFQGDHSVSRAFRLNWSAVYSKASNSVPDWSEDEIQQGSSSTDVPHFYGLNRIWLTNSDQDYTGYLNLYYNRNLEGNNLEISTGGLYRSKVRDCKYYSYQLSPYQDANQNYPPFYNGVDVMGPEYWTFNNGIGGDGSLINPNTYTSHEQIAAGYIQGKLLLHQQWEIIGGVRAEHTYQDWATPMPQTFRGAYGSKSYLDVLPSLNVKYRVTQNDNLRAAYFKSINRPGFFEIVPTEMPSDYFKEAGNPYLQHATIDNIDLRYERFTKTLDQISIGVFYKHITNPIEQLWHKDSTSTSGDVIGPANSGSAQNFGAEIALTKYWGRFGVSGNYTYTNSQISTSKLYAGTTSIGVTSQTRPLQGQSPHIANLSLLYKDVDHGLNLQLAMAYTGTRITFVSPYQNLDYWQQPFFTLDFSLEKNFLNSFSFYLKAQNLLNTPYEVYLHHMNPYMAGSGANELPLQGDKNKILVQREYYGQNFIAGFRFKFPNDLSSK